MAVANPWLQKEWEEWKRSVEEDRRRRLIWMERVMLWARLYERKEDGEEEEDGEAEEEESINDEKDNMREEEEVDSESDEKEGGDVLVVEAKKGERDVTGEEFEVEKEESGREHKEVAEEVSEVEEQEDGNEKTERREVDEVADKELGETEVGEEGEGENEEPNEVKWHEVDVVESNLVKDDVEGGDKEGEKEVHREVKEDMVTDKELKEVERERSEEEGEDKRRQMESEGDGDMEGCRMEQKNQEEVEKQQEHKQKQEHHLDEHIQQNQETTGQEGTGPQLEDLSDLLEFDNLSKNSKLMGSEDEEQIDGERHKYDAIKDGEVDEEKLCVNDKENCRKTASMERKEDDQETVTESSATYDEFQDDLLDEEEEEFTEDDEGEPLADEDSDEVKIYNKDDHPRDIFHTLNGFRDSFVLTDLILNTVDGKGLHVHSVILAAVSSLIKKTLSGSNGVHDRPSKRQYTDTGNQVHIQSVSLGPEVNHVGLEAIVEFSYTGVISCLNSDTIEKIKIAARTLGVPRVMDICTKEEKKSAKTAAQKTEEKVSTEAQLMISLQSIKKLWMDRVGCDVILGTLEASFHVHRVILAASSDYFRAMFTLGMKESNQPVVKLPFQLAAELEALIGCSYSGTLPLNWSCIFEITSTALQLQYQPALSMCLNFLQQEINPQSCLDVASFAKAYGMAELLEVAEDFVLRQFQKVACTSKFRDLPAKQLLKYLNSLSLCVPSELVVFRAVVAWIQAKPKVRLRLAKELMKTIHFPLMTFKEFKEVRNQNMWSEHSLTELYEAIFEDFCSKDVSPQNECRIYLPKESLVLIGGDQISEDLGSRSISRELWFGNSLRNHMGIKKAMEWRKLGEMPDEARFCHEVAVLKGQLYVIGGKKYYGLYDTLSSAYRYDPLQNNWEALAEMRQRRCSFSVVVLDGKIYAIGGHCDPEYIDSVERYCPTTNSWSYTFPLDLPLSGHVARVLQGRIFISGGLNNDYQCLASTFLYHPERGSTYLDNMSESRAYHCMEVLGDCFYVAGGMTSPDNVNVSDQLTCEMYNPAADSWTSFPPLPVPHVGAGSAVLEGKFYVLGGYSQEDYNETKTVHRYDPVTQKWENMGKTPGPNNDIRGTVLCLPAHFRL